MLWWNDKSPQRDFPRGVDKLRNQFSLAIACYMRDGRLLLVWNEIFFLTQDLLFLCRRRKLRPGM